MITPKEDPDPAVWVAEFQDEAAELEKVWKAVNFAAQRTAAAVDRKNLRLERSNRDFVKLVDVLMALFILAGCERQAATIRPSRQDPGELLRWAKHRRATSATLKAKKEAGTAEPDDETASQPPPPPSPDRSDET